MYVNPCEMLSVYSTVINRTFRDNGDPLKLCCSVWELLSALAFEHLNVASATEKLFGFNVR